MSMIESPPKIEQKDFFEALMVPPGKEMAELVDKINEEYAYWDVVKYKPLPQGYTHEQLWTYVKASRIGNMMNVWDKYHIHLNVTNQMQRMCHEFDMNFVGAWGTDTILSDAHKERYLVSSLMEEAIFSSQMEGASTTRRVAKDLLRKKIAPKDRSQQMIANNYQTIQFVVEHPKTPLTVELLLRVHQLMTENTLDDRQDAGRFRTNDDVVVENGITHEIVHRPPSHTEILSFVEDLCRFFNDNDPVVFIHPIIRGIIIHFMVAYIHPFVDGNGRTARALFYWYMLKQGYWLAEYLSISRVIARSKKAYERSFLNVEADNNDIGYFVAYNLRVLDLAFKQLQIYLRKEQEGKKVAHTFVQLGGINERQAQIVKMFIDNPKEVVTVKDIQARFLVSPTTAKSDLMGLVNQGFVSEFAFNRVKKGYMRSESFEEKIKPLMR
ncbi:Fic family protein [Hoylesella enoeca]|uniref:Fic family protein n=1 Tax=Hoylesella enoeca TaxID=76123 RepID=UPI004058C978